MNIVIAKGSERRGQLYCNVGAFGVLRQSRSFRAAKTFGAKGHYRSVRWCGNTLFSKTLRVVARVPMECCGKAAAFVQRKRLALKGHCRSVRWCVNTLFSKTLREVALRAIGLTGASAHRLFENVRRVSRRDTAWPILRHPAHDKRGPDSGERSVAAR